MAVCLQRGFPDQSDIVKPLILLDGSHHYMRTYRNVYRMAYGLSGDSLANNPFFETEILSAFCLRFAIFDYKALRLELLSRPDWDSRVTKVVDILMDTGLFPKPQLIVWATTTLRAKFIAADK